MYVGNIEKIERNIFEKYRDANKWGRESKF